MSNITRQRFLAVLALGLGAFPLLSRSADWPDGPVHLVVPTVPGGATDFTARYVAQRLGTALGQPVLVDYKAGADGQIGLELAARSAPNGYTLVMPITSFPINPSLYDSLPFDTVKDFDAVVLVSKAPLLLVVNAALPVASVRELIDYAKANPGKLNFGNSGSGTTSSLAGQMFRKMAGIDIQPISYKGGGQIMTDLIAGQIQIYFSTIPAALQLVNAGKLRVLGITSSTRMPNLPEIPTIAEAGLPGFDVVGWFGIFAPAGTPRPIVERINREVVKIIDQPDSRSAFAKEGLIVGGGSPDDLKEFLSADIARWKKVITEAGIKRD